MVVVAETILIFFIPWVANNKPYKVYIVLITISIRVELTTSVCFVLLSYYFISA